MTDERLSDRVRKDRVRKALRLAICRLQRVKACVYRNEEHIPASFDAMPDEIGNEITTQKDMSRSDEGMLDEWEVEMLFASNDMQSRRERIDVLTKELYYIMESIDTCNELLESVQEFKEKIKQQYKGYLDEMSLSVKDWRLNLMEAGAINNNIQAMVGRCERIRDRVSKELAELKSQEDGGDYEGNATLIKR